MESQEAQYGRKHEYDFEQLKMSKKLMVQLIIQHQQLSKLIYKKIRQGLF